MINDKNIIITDYDASEYLTQKKLIKFYLEESIKSDNPEQIILALNNIAKSNSMTDLAKKSGISRAGLYKALSKKGNPSFYSIYKIAKSMGLKIKLELES